VKKQVVSSLADIERLEHRVATSATETVSRLNKLLAGPALSVLAAMKFEQSGCDPLDAARPLNLVEQLNQSFTYLATLEAAKWLMREHAAHAPFTLNLGTTPGSDIESTDKLVCAETFAATHPDSNDKLRNDLARLRASSATHRYVFYLSPRATRRSEVDGIRIVRLSHACLSARTDA
jgi:hypothetical protein